MLKPRRELAWNVLVHVVILDRQQRVASSDRVERRAATMQRGLAKQAEHFEALLGATASIVRKERVSSTGCTLDWFDRTAA